MSEGMSGGWREAGCPDGSQLRTSDHLQLPEDPAGHLQRIAADELELRQVDEAVCEAETGLARFSGAPALTDAERRIEADVELLLRLSTSQFVGPDWEAFRDKLARYGWAVIRAWCRSGKIFSQCRRIGFGALREPPVAIRRDDAEELAAETVAVALNFFRDDVLVPRLWKSTKGATLATFFVGACIRKFANVYDRWCRENQRLRLVDPDALDLNGPRSVQSHGRLAVERALGGLSEEQCDLVARRALGHEHSEIADELGVPLRQVERRLEKIRQAARASQQGNDHD